MPDIASLRREYSKKSLKKREVHPDPLVQFDVWFREAIQAEVPEPNAMTLSTVSAEGQPSGRIVLLKGVEEGNFLFYTNYDSRKGRELVERPLAALTFFWHELERQVRVEGRVVKVSPEVSDAYFNSRPLGSRIGAMASPQSSAIQSRDWLEERMQSLEQEYQEQAPMRPENWGGFALEPTYMEFWQGRPSRLHDRIAYTKLDGNWKIERLAP